MAIQKVRNIVISDGTALPTAGASITTIGNGDIGIFTKAMVEITPGNTVSDSDYIYLGQKDSNGNFRKTNPIYARNVKNFAARSYAPAAREVWTIGYNRKTAAGTLETNSSTEYKFSIHFTGDKVFYSERPMIIRKSFTTDSSASKLEIAAFTADAINNDTFLSKYVSAIIVGNGTLATSTTATVNGSTHTIYSSTGATEYGCEIMGLPQTQFNTAYTEDRVRFDVHVDDTSGFGPTSTCTQIQAMSFGTGTYQEVYNMENFAFGAEGSLNRTKFPFPTLTYQTSSTPILSAVVTATTGNVTATISTDGASVATSTAILRGGELIDINSVNYEIKYVIDATTFVLTAAASASYSGANLKVRYLYDLINIEFENVVTRSTSGHEVAEMVVVIAVPAIDTAGAYNSNSTAGTSVLAALNPYFASVGFANVNV